MLPASRRLRCSWLLWAQSSSPKPQGPGCIGMPRATNHLFPGIRGVSHSQHPVVRIRAHRGSFYLCLEVSSIKSNI